MTIRPAEESDAARVSALAIQSKAAWGYDPEMMDVFREELTLSGEALVAARGHVAESRGEIIGYYTLVRRSAPEVELEHLFVDPGRFREGIGSALLKHAIETARNSGFVRMTIISDPNSAGFYEHHGAVLTGQHASADIPGRLIPIYGIEM